MGLDRKAITTLWRELYALMKALACSPIPVCAAIIGHAPAGGTVLPLFCDWRIMADGEFKIGLNEVQVGIPLPAVILAALRRQVGPRQAERLSTTGLLMSPTQALEIGLVDELVPTERVVERSVEWCKGMTALPVEAMTATRHEARADLIALFSHDLDAELKKVSASWWHPETQATLRAVVDRLKKKY
jgi:enoyl-CoA hydratase/carnithine racemase